ncbi:hypothetical protein RND81_12G092400 [Saponaria officinalis]|uniref:Secreted protein n=1 Tax=Saponaria officinalis TaxID=3572 RepID=A0AAW1H8D9_SAPOF
MTKSVCLWKVVRILLTPLTHLQRLTLPALSMIRHGARFGPRQANRGNKRAKMKSKGKSKPKRTTL